MDEGRWMDVWLSVAPSVNFDVNTSSSCRRSVGRDVIHSFVHLSIYPFIYSSMHSFINPFSTPYMHACIFTSSLVLESLFTDHKQSLLLFQLPLQKYAPLYRLSRVVVVMMMMMVVMRMMMMIKATWLNLISKSSRDTKATRFALSRSSLVCSRLRSRLVCSSLVVCNSAT